MRYEQLDAALHAIRSAASDDPDMAAATQLRVRRSLDARARGRHQLVGLLTTVAILFAGTVSWALATGQIAALWVPAAPAPASAPRDGDARSESRAVPRSAPRPAVLMGVPLPPLLPPEAVTPRAPIAALPGPEPRVLSVAPRSWASVEVLYRAAHDLHFHGGAPEAALRAWDAYLAAEPAGRFSVEARYNRALILVRLGRYAEARTALLPFARGAVEPSGYRQPEAAQLVERLGAAE